MFAGLRKRLTYANVTATLAVFMVLGGGAYAATQLPRNSVGSRQLRSNAVSSSKVKDRSLLARDFKAGQLPRGATGQPGQPGQPGPGATTFTRTLVSNGAETTIVRLSNGLTVVGRCPNHPSVTIQTTSGLGNLEASGTQGTQTQVDSVDVPAAAQAPSIQFDGTDSTDFDGLARDKTVGKFARLDVHGDFGVSPAECHFWGMVIPSG
jgi:hypothetical protein